MKIGMYFAGMALATALCISGATALHAQDPHPAVTSDSNAAATSPLPLDQAVTKTVHEAWVASGRNEDKFFAIVQQLAELSAQNRDVTLPDTKEAGEKFGDWIKRTARKDPDQLLYAVVDGAVRYVGQKQQASAAAPAPSK